MAKHPTKPRKKSGKTTPSGESKTVCAMKLRVYASDKQESRLADWLYSSQKFRNEAVSWLKDRQKTRRAWLRQHPALGKAWIPEEFAGSDHLACSRWLTERLQAARGLVCAQAGWDCTKNDQMMVVSKHLKSLSRTEREELTDAWLLAVPRTVLDQVLQDVAKTIAKAIKDRKEKLKNPAGFPDFKKFHYPSSIRLQVEASKNTAFREHWAAGEVFIPGLGRLAFRDSGYDLPQTPPKLITVARNAAGQLFVSFICVAGEGKAYARQGALIAAPVPMDPETGLPKIDAWDLGLKDRSSNTAGKKSGRDRHLKAYQSRLRRQSKTLSRRQRGSGRWKRAKRELGKTHVKVANCREALLRQEAQDVVSNNAIVCLETLFLAFMLQNTHLAQSAHDAALGRFQQLIEHECRKHGHLLLRCGPFDASSKTCSACGEINHTLKLSDRTWACPGCGIQHDRDTNAAVNIRRMALLRALLPDQSKTVPESGVGNWPYRLKPELASFIARGGLTTLREYYAPVSVAPKEPLGGCEELAKRASCQPITAWMEHAVMG